jgi:hypothetical protein
MSYFFVGLCSSTISIAFINPKAPILFGATLGSSNFSSCTTRHTGKQNPNSHTRGHTGTWTTGDILRYPTVTFTTFAWGLLLAFGDLQLLPLVAPLYAARRAAGLGSSPSAPPRGGAARR